MYSLKTRLNQIKPTYFCISGIIDRNLQCFLCEISFHTKGTMLQTDNNGFIYFKWNFWIDIS